MKIIQIITALCLLCLTIGGGVFWYRLESGQIGANAAINTMKVVKERARPAEEALAQVAATGIYQAEKLGQPIPHHIYGDYEKDPIIMAELARLRRADSSLTDGERREQKAKHMAKKINRAIAADLDPEFIYPNYKQDPLIVAELRRAQ